MNQSSSLTTATETFNSILGIRGKAFGQTSTKLKGVSDNNNGVQWNVDLESGRAELGVNLEGMEYNNWPISIFLSREIRNPTFPSQFNSFFNSDKIFIGLYRDAWQVKSRPPIVQKNIKSSGIRLKNLTKTKWIEMLEEAYECLNSQKNHKGRALQDVILIKSGEKKEMQVSPHLTIYTKLWENSLMSNSEADKIMREAFKLLFPIYNFVKTRSDEYRAASKMKDYIFDFENQVKLAIDDSENSRKSRIANASISPKTTIVETVVYYRNPDIVASVLVRARGICERCKKQAPFLKAKDRSPYLEVHHKIHLAHGGHDTEENAIALCPNCHRELHFGETNS